MPWPAPWVPTLVALLDVTGTRLQEVKGLRILGPTEPKDRVSIFSFVIEDRQALDIVQALDALGIAVRGGDLASLPLMKRMGVTVLHSFAGRMFREFAITARCDP